MKYGDVIYSLNKFVHENIETKHSLHVNYTNTLDDEVLAGNIAEAIYVFFLTLVSPYQSIEGAGANVRFGIYTSVASDPTHRRLYQLADIVKEEMGSISAIPFYDFSNVTSATDEPIDTGKTIPIVWFETIPVTLTNQMTCNIMYLDYKLFVSELCLDMDAGTNVFGVGENRHG